MKRSTLIYVASTAASAGMVLAVAPMEWSHQTSASTLEVEADWLPPTIEVLGFGNGWAQHAGLDSTMQVDVTTNDAAGEPYDAATVKVNGQVVGWVVPDSNRLQALMNWETEQARAIVAERERRASISVTPSGRSRSVVSRFSGNDESRTRMHDDPRIRVRSRPYLGTTYRKPAWLEAWGRTLDRLQRQHDNNRRLH